MTIGTASAGTFTVNNSTGPVADFTSIQDAVNASNDGDTILVYLGFYEENVDISQANITIESESGPDVTTVQDVTGVDDCVFSIGKINEGVNNVTINGFNVTGGNGIHFYESSGELRNNIISDGGIRAVSSHITVINNTIISKGISFSYLHTSALLENNEVFSCSGAGIHILDQARVTLVNNTIYNNSAGIEMFSFADGHIYNNTIYGNEIGIDIVSNSYGKVANNTIYGNGEVGIRILDDSRGDVYNNYFNNTMNAQTDEPDPDIGPSTWNTTKTAGPNIIGGPYLGGNYWANPDGTGFSQTHGGVDGICDLPYIIDGNNIDYLPLCLLTPIEETENLKEYVNGLDGEVADSTKHVLNVKLDNVIDKLDKGDNDKAIKKLEDFIKFVGIMERQGKLDGTQAAYLISEAERIIEMIQNSEG
ncbi:NosD domain-containing protein [Methanococcoides sp. AM1]|uniref:NosD domain-containing protein n=1 Tax=Methanococcoides sp. AM1 TaxID=1201011 RepID=UPI0014386D22|nr:NosD domain-containing protein [Methanococcoides sp. AM1]